MADPNAKFLKVLKAELEDLIEDIGLVQRRSGERHQRGEITEYVFKENEALFRLEAEAVRELLSIIDAIDLSLYTNLDSLVEAVETRVREALRDRAEPEAIFAFVRRKIAKVRAYIEADE